MIEFDRLQHSLREAPKKWLVTGVAGFIGSNLLEVLLKLNQEVVGLDNFSTGKPENLDQVRASVGSCQASRFRFIQGDIREPLDCQRACQGVDFVLHQAALGSVPRSISDPLTSHASNVTGFINMLVAARDQKVQRLVYASSSSVYGDHPDLPKVEEKIGRPLSPYAATKAMNETYADVFAKCYGLGTIGLRYFNVFGPRQDPFGAYAAVIPKWISAIMKGEAVVINGDGDTSRDFCFVQNAVQANLLAATTGNLLAVNQTYNVAVGERTSLNELHAVLQKGLAIRNPALQLHKPVYQGFRAGDVRHSLAAISKARSLLGYEPQFRIADGMELAMDWYCQNLK